MFQHYALSSCALTCARLISVPRGSGGKSTRVGGQQTPEFHWQACGKQALPNFWFICCICGYFVVFAALNKPYQTLLDLQDQGLS